jgi:hypothetical protein
MLSWAPARSYLKLIYPRQAELCPRSGAAHEATGLSRCPFLSACRSQDHEINHWGKCWWWSWYSIRVCGGQCVVFLSFQVVNIRIASNKLVVVKAMCLNSNKENWTSRKGDMVWEINTLLQFWAIFWKELLPFAVHHSTSVANAYLLKAMT